MSVDSSVQSTASIPNKHDYTERLLNLMQRRLELLQSLDAVCDLQTECTDDPDVSVLLKVLSRKQVLLEELEVLRQDLEPYLLDDPARRVWKSIERRQYCQLIAEQGHNLLRKMMAGDEATLQEVSRRRDAVASQLQDGTDSVLARTAYTADYILDASELDIGDV